MSVSDRLISERLQTALEAYASVGDGCWLYDIANDSVRLTHDWVHKLGYSPEQAATPGFFASILPPDQAPRVLSNLRDLARNDAQTLSDRFELRTASGQRLHIFCRGMVVERGQDGSPLMAAGIHLDTSDCHDLATRLHDSEATFRQIFDNMPAAMAILDLRGNIERVNTKFLELTQYAETEILGNNARMFEASSRPEKDLGSTIRAIRENGFARIERTYRKKDGTHFWANAYAGALFDEDGAPTRLLGVLHDETERRDSEVRLRRALRELDAILENSLTGIAVMRGNTLTRVNRRMAEILGYRPSELEGVHAADLHISPRHYRNFLTLYSRHLSTTRFINIEYPVRRKDGAELWCRISGKAVDRRDLSRGVVWCCEDVTEERESKLALRKYADELLEAQKAQREHAMILSRTVQELDEKNEHLRQEALQRQAAEEALRESERRYCELSRRDDLTGLYNSRHFYEVAARELKRAQRYQRPLSLLFMDIDDFKRFNDTYGHLEGDKVLKKLGKIIEASVRDTDSAFRYGGEEFIILLPETDRDEAVRLADRIRNTFAATTLRPQGREDRRTLSVGVAQFRSPETLAELISRADSAMYDSKHGGKNSTCIAD